MTPSVEMKGLEEVAAVKIDEETLNWSKLLVDVIGALEKGAEEFPVVVEEGAFPAVVASESNFAGRPDSFGSPTTLC